MNRRMTIRQPFDLALSLEMGQAFRWRRVGDEGVRQRDWGDPPGPWRRNGEGWYSGVLGEYLVHVRQTGDGLEYRVGGEHGERDDVDLDRRLHDHFRLDDDIGEIYGQLGQRPAVARAIGRYPGLRLLRQDRWECLVSHLCSGTNSIRGIRNCVEKIAQLSRRKVYLDGDERHVFPDPVQIVDAGLKTLEKLNLGLPSRSHNIFLMAIHLSHDPLLVGPDLRPRSLRQGSRQAAGQLPGHRPQDRRLRGADVPGKAGCVSGGPVDAAGPGPVRSGGDAGKVGGEGTEPPNHDRSAAVPGGGVGPGVFRRVRRLRQPVPVSLDRAPQGAGRTKQDLTPLRAGSDR